MTQGLTLQVLPTREEAISFLGGELKRAVLEIPQEIQAMSEAEIVAHRKPTKVDSFLRKNLWIAIDNAKRNNETQIHASQIYQGVCSATNFESRVMMSPLRLAWLLFHPRTDMEKWEEALSYGLDRFREEFITMPITKETAGHFLRALEMLMNRVHGQVVTRIEAKHAHMNVKDKQSDEPIQDRVEELRTKIIQQRDVTPEIKRSSS